MTGEIGYSFEKTAYETEVEQLGPLADYLEDGYAVNPPGNDPHITAFALALAGKIYEPEASDLRSCLIPSITFKPNESLPYKANKLLRESIKHATSKDWEADSRKPRFPHDFIDQEAWGTLFDWIMEDGSRRGEFMLDLLSRDVSSNIPQRGVIIPIAIGLIRRLQAERFVEPPSLLIPGSSQMLTEIKMLSESPFTAPEIVADVGGEKVIDEEATDYIRQLIEDVFKPGPMVSADVVRPNDPGAREWTISCSRYPKEHYDERLEREFEFLYSRQSTIDYEANGDGELSFKQADITNSKDLLRAGVTGSFDAVFMSEVRYLIDPKLRPATDKNTAALVKKGPEAGIKLEQEFAQLTGYGGLRIYRDKHRKPYRFGAFLTDFVANKPTREQVMQWKNGRCDVGQLGSWAIRAMAELGVPILATPGRSGS